MKLKAALVGLEGRHWLLQCSLCQMACPMRSSFRRGGSKMEQVRWVPNLWRCWSAYGAYAYPRRLGSISAGPGGIDAAPSLVSCLSTGHSFVPC
jgi:hypothetical protein